MTKKKTDDVVYVEKTEDEVYPEKRVAEIDPKWEDYVTDEPAGHMSLDDLRKITHAKALNALTGTMRDEFAGMPLYLHAIHEHPVSLLIEATGELRSSRRIIWEIEDPTGGNRPVYLAFVSDSATEFSDLLGQYRPEKVFEPALAVQFKSVRTRKGFTTFSFEVL